MNNLKKIRINKGLTQTEMGEIMGVSRYEVMKKERGLTVLNEHQIKKICMSLDVSADYLLGLTEKNSNKA